MSFKTYYAIGDIHGMYKMYKVMINAILDDIVKNNVEHPHIVFLGDYVDRGPQSRKVVWKIKQLQSECETLATGVDITVLRGNHEDMMLNAYYGGRDDYRHWLRNGGQQTLDSYGDGAFPAPAIMKWLGDLPYHFKDDEAKILFVHAGIIPRLFPELDPETSIWTRSPAFFADDHWKDLYDELDGWLIVHGHTPDFDQWKAYYSPRRINLDTGAVYGGSLSGVKITPDRKFTSFKVKQDLTLKIKEKKVNDNPSEV